MLKLHNNDASLARSTGTTGSLEVDEPPQGGGQQYYLGIDGGGTKTHAVVTDSSCAVIGEGFSGGSNPLRVGLDDAVSHIDQAINEACSSAGITRRSIAGGCVAVAGVKHPIHHDTMKEALDQALGIRNLRLVTDAQAALSGALDGKPGVVVIAGTGSIAVGIDAAGRVERSGGWGPAFSDEGSGFDIARRLLHAVVASFDGRQPTTILTDRVCRHLGISTAEDLPGVIYSSDSAQLDISSLATLAVEAADEGDAVARAILSDAGRELGALAVSVLRKLGVESERLHVAFVGSVFQAGAYVLESFREVVLQAAPNVQIGPAMFSPAVGAVKLLQLEV